MATASWPPRVLAWLPRSFCSPSASRSWSTSRSCASLCRTGGLATPSLLKGHNLTTGWSTGELAGRNFSVFLRELLAPCPCAIQPRRAREGCAVSSVLRVPLRRALKPIRFSLLASLEKESDTSACEIADVEEAMYSKQRCTAYSGFQYG